jgi:hypothetical protein
MSPWAFSFDFSTVPSNPPEVLQPATHPQASSQSDRDASVAEIVGSSLPLENETENTTLCTLAFSLVMKNNRKGYMAADLDLKLRAGYRCSSMTSEGCRVDNKVLFSVLAEIS